MGSPFSPLTANIFIEDFERKALSSYPNPPQFWGCYADDTMVIINRCEIENITNHIKALHPAIIKFTIEREVNGQLPILDVRVIRETDGTLSFQVYWKPTSTNQYLNFSFHHPMQHKLGVIRTLVERASSIVTKKEEQVKVLRPDNIYRSLAVCGYSKWAMDIANNRTKETCRSAVIMSPHTKLKAVLPSPIWLVLVKASAVAYILRLNYPSEAPEHHPLHACPTNMTKDKTEKLDKAGVIYDLSLDCPSSPRGDCEDS